MRKRFFIKSRKEEKIKLEWKTVSHTDRAERGHCAGACLAEGLACDAQDNTDFQRGRAATPLGSAEKLPWEV